MKKRIAILGGGPSALFVYKRFVESGRTDLEIHIYESKQLLGAGMPYSFDGANSEHVTNVSDNEVPQIVTTIAEWVQTVPEAILSGFHMDRNRFNEYKVLPRLLFGQYLSAQFTSLLEQAEEIGLPTVVHLSSKVADIIDKSEINRVDVQVEGAQIEEFDQVIICTGHNWPGKHEGVVPGYFDSPYPPSKLKLKLNHEIAIRGSSLTAIDAIRTLARSNGSFSTDDAGQVLFVPDAGSEAFKLVLHSRNGLLPAIRFHLEEPLLSTESLLTKQELADHISENGGFLSLDYVFEKNFKNVFEEKDPEFHELIRDMSMEDFVAHMMDRRERVEPFALFKAEYKEAEKSIKRRESIHWKEMLAVLSFAMNYPAKYLSAEDMLRLQKVLMPLISIVIAFAPQSSAQELLALHDAGKLEIVSVGDDSKVLPKDGGGAAYYFKGENGSMVETYYQTFVDCIGQPHLNYNAFPFKSLVEKKTVSPARIKFRSPDKARDLVQQDDDKVDLGTDGDYYLNVPGITINDSFQVVDDDGIANDRIYVMAVPYIGGYNPDYSGLDFCEQASESIVNSMIS
jgi:uncharacterized NAD(P)/FAD-binding protein YdhS